MQRGAMLLSRQLTSKVVALAVRCHGMRVIVLGVMLT
jgi:hypothetical protein